VARDLVARDLVALDFVPLDFVARDFVPLAFEALAFVAVDFVPLAFEALAFVPLAFEALAFVARDFVALAPDRVVGRLVPPPSRAVRCAAGPSISATGISSWATSTASCGMRSPRKSAIRSSSRSAFLASLAVSLSPTEVASASSSR